MHRTHIKQRDITDCGAACLASVAAHYQLRFPVARIRQLASTDQKGTTILGLVHAAKTLGFDSKAVRGPLESLSTIPLPAIAHVIVRETLHHYAVIYKVTPTQISVMDPATGTMDVHTPEQFRSMWTGVLLLLVPNEHFKSGNHKKSLFRTLWQLIQPHRYIVLQALFGSLIYTMLGLSTSVYVQLIVDYVFIHENGNLLNLMSVVMLILVVIQAFIGVTRSFLTIRTGQEIDRQLILSYYQHLLKLPQLFFDSMRIGEIISRINDAVKIRMFINETMLNLSMNCLFVFLCLSLMSLYNWQLTLLLSLSVPLYAAVYFAASHLNRTVERRVMEQSADLESQLVESIQTIRTIKSFGLEGRAHLKTAASFDRLLATLYQSGKNGIFSASSPEIISRLSTIAVLWSGSSYVLHQELTPGMLLSFYTLIGYFTGPVSSLISMNKLTHNAMIAADRLFEIMDLEPESESSRKVTLTREMTGDIQLRDVMFRYGSRLNIFEQLTLTIPKGEVTAVIGESGSGKSTLISILQGLYPIQQGEVRIGEYNLRHISLESLRKIIGTVPQKIDLFAGNVIENIALDDEVDMKRIIGLCGELGVLEFIESLPRGFDTYLGENGATLSGGQKQRLAIVRALYHNPEILILDEATSSLDSVAEVYVHRMVKLLRLQGKTVIIIAHRLSTVRDADKIIVLDHGVVVEEGSHNQLMKRNGKYCQLWQYQAPAMAIETVS